MKKVFSGIFLVLFTLSVLAGCADKKTEVIEIVATDNGWDSQKLHNAIAKIIVENGFEGYSFSVSTASSTMNWQSIIAGEVDLDIESWTDNVASYPEDVANGDIVDIGVLVSDSKQGLYVPRYVIEGDKERDIEPMAPDLKTVKDLLKYPDVFKDYEDPEKGLIYGGLPGWMADDVLSKKYKAYGLDKDYNYKRLGDEASLFSSLSSAYNLGEPWLGYSYEPTWVSGKLDIVLLEDEPYSKDLIMDGLCGFAEQELKIVSSGKFAEKAPDLLEFFKKYQTGSKLVASSLAYIDETSASHEDTAKWLLIENDYLLDEWLTKDQADKVRAYLKK